MVFFSLSFERCETLELLGIEGEEIFHSYNMRKNINLTTNFLQRSTQPPTYQNNCL
jgi:hypothetical protein